MAQNENKIYVYENFTNTEPILMGYLYSISGHASENYSFEFDRDWLEKNTQSIVLDPQISPFLGRQYPQNKQLFGIFSDSAPDRWGRILIKKRERILAEKEERKPRNLTEIDFLLGVDDETRMGGLRFKLKPDGDFISSDNISPVPPWARLRTLEEMSRRFEIDELGIEDEWIEQLVRQGSSLGGARPKATVKDTKGELWIAKFPSKNDEANIGAWEMVAHDLAALCDLNVPNAKLLKFSDLGSTYLSKRFDREASRRIHFASAMTLLNKIDGDSATEGVSYLDIADIIKSQGVNPVDDLPELWKRIVFNMAISNTDDHLRNHAFILTKEGWKLSPLYDVNPVPYGNELSLNVDAHNNEINLELAIETSSSFGLEKDKANNIAKCLLSTVKSNWEKIAKKHGITAKEIREMKPAFSLYGQY